MSKRMHSSCQTLVAQYMFLIQILILWNRNVMQASKAKNLGFL